MTTVTARNEAVLGTLPGDDVRQIMWRYADRYDLQMIVQAARSVARGPVARLVAAGGRNSHEWTAEKSALLQAYDDAGITAMFLDVDQGGFIEGPKNFAMALAAFELAWVDGGAATGSLAGNLALAPIHERGTPEQRAYYMSRCAPPPPGEDRAPWRGSFALTEPLPFVGVDTGVLSGKLRIVEWEDGKEPVLQVEKRGRFITNMAYANFVTAAVDTDDPRIKSSCMVILEESDPGIYDRGAATKKLVHQLSATNDPIFNLRIPASRIIGGYSVKDGTIVPNYSHSQVIEAVFRRTRVTVGLMTAAKLLSAIEPVIRYQRGRFRGGEGAPGTPRYELGLQMKEDALHRLANIWATGEASAAFGFATTLLCDDFDVLEKEKDAILAAKGISGGRAQMKLFREIEPDAVEFVRLSLQPESERDAARFAELSANALVRYLATDAVASVFCPAVKLWCTGNGATVMRDAVALMGGYGITEDCPGFLGQKWMDCQLEATYEGPEAVQRRHMSITMTNPIFLAWFDEWTGDLRRIATRRPGTGACALASAMELWRWSLDYLLGGTDADGRPLYRDQRQGVTFPMADALAWLLAARAQILSVIELEEKGPENPSLADALPGFVRFFTDLCHIQAARAAGEVSRICTELVFGYNRHPAWDEGCACCSSEQIDAAESLVPGIAFGTKDVVESDGSHAPKAGPCVRFAGRETFMRLHAKLAGCLTGVALARDRAAESLTKVMIPEALDYPM